MNIEYMIIYMDMNKIYFCQKLWFHINDYEQSDYEFILIPSQWRLFIGTLIPNQWGLFVGTLIPKPIGVIHWYSDAQLRGYSITIVIRLLRIWITFEYLNYFESLKLHMWIFEIFEYLNYFESSKLLMYLFWNIL